MAVLRSSDDENLSFGKLKISPIVVVEGKYDKIKLDNIIDGTIITCDGFSIYKDSKKKKLIRELGNTYGVIILTDSDKAGMQLRNYIKEIVDEDKVQHVYIPDVFGKEKRKNKPAKEGKIGVEGIDIEIIKKAFEDVAESPHNDNKICTSDLYGFGLSGSADSKAKRKALLKKLGLPDNLNTTLLLSVLNKRFDRESLFDFLELE